MLEVKRLRQAREWNQTELAYHAGLAPSVISEIENGKRDPNARTLRKLAEALEVDVADLFPKAQPPLPLELEGQRGLEKQLDEAGITTSWLVGPKEEIEKVVVGRQAYLGKGPPPIDASILLRAAREAVIEFREIRRRLFAKTQDGEPVAQDRALVMAYVDINGRMFRLAYALDRLANEQGASEKEREDARFLLSAMAELDPTLAALLREYYRKAEVEATTPTRNESA